MGPPRSSGISPNLQMMNIVVQGLHTCKSTILVIGCDASPAVIRFEREEM